MGAGFQIMPTYNEGHHCLDRHIFMNNYGVRKMPEGSNFVAWNWNAPLWFGINTINVDGCTTTLVGSSFWGIDVVEKLRDNMEKTLREVMSKAPDGAGSMDIPSSPCRARSRLNLKKADSNNSV